jgi:phosphopantothenoylcysteine decarboxylase/phosphopantothenate--cysteine ligase
VLAELGERRSGVRPFLVGFAVETARGEELVELARGKLGRKKVDLVVANHAADAFGREDNRVVLVSETEAEELPQLSKAEVADRLLDAVRRHLGG